MLLNYFIVEGNSIPYCPLTLKSEHIALLCEPLNELEAPACKPELYILGK